jgi:hypothetical protein
MNGSVIPFERRAAPDSDAEAIRQRIARCVYMIQRHQEGVRLNARRIADLEAELKSIEARRA